MTMKLFLKKHLIKSTSFILLILVVTISFSCGNENTQCHEYKKGNEFIQNSKDAYIALNKKTHNFGRINKKKELYLKTDFEIENKGIAPLVITKVDVSCGCVTVNFPKYPILSKDKAKLTVYMDIRNQEGIFNKSIIIKSNASNNLTLIKVKGEIHK